MKILVISLSVICALLIGVILATPQDKEQFGFTTDSNIGTQNATNTTAQISVAATSTLVLGKSNYKYISICHTGENMLDASPTSLFFTATDTVGDTQSGYQLEPGECWEQFPLKFIWNSDLYGNSTGTATSVLSIISY